MSQHRATRGSGADVRPAISSVHQGQPCQPCILCKRGNMSKYFHPKSWKDGSLLKKLQEFEPALGINPDSCICRNCRQDVSSIGESSFVPRWRKINDENEKEQQCYVSECNECECKSTTLADRATICSLFDMNIERIETPRGTDGIPLCTYHYGVLYRKLNPSHLKCKTCSKHISDFTKSRVVSEPDIIEAFLSENTVTSSNESISSSDRVCFTCYKSHLYLLKRLKGSVKSTDSDLQLLLDKIESDIPILSNVRTSDEVLSYVSSLSAIHVGKAILKQTALLLPEVYETFKIKLSKMASEMNITVDFPNSIWLRSELSNMLEHHMAYKCSVMRIGTILYRHGGDIFYALSVALGHCRRHETKDKLSEVCLTLNEKCHKSINELIEQDSGQPHNIESIDINKFINKLDPDIWRAISLLTKPLSKKAIKNTSQVRTIRRFFCVCVLFFTINNQCSFPIHTLLTEAIETCGGSIRLVRMFNRLGICASSETALRYVQYRIEKRASEGIMKSYPSNCFMIASADNIDYIHHYARVYCGKQQLSWHGTTVQIAQPKPLTLTTNTDLIGNRMLTKRVYSTRSPIKSPQPKKLRRSRTGAIRALSASEESSNTIYTHVQSTETTPLSMNDFGLKLNEESALKKFQNIAGNYILLKVACTAHATPLIDFQAYFSLSSNICSVERSNIIYYNVLDQKCDDNETVLSIINDLYNKFIATKKQALIFLEGDQVTYARIQSLKAEYGSDLAWLIPFPGDWHILKNYQEVLVKIYFDAGLVDIGKCSGYNTPNSITSNFKRTHHFLMEAWESMYRLLFSIFLEKGNVPTDFLHTASEMVQNLPPSETQESALRNINQLLEDLQEKCNVLQLFDEYIQKRESENKTVKFWIEFIFRTCVGYIALYCAVRTGQWDLRMAAIKLMVPIFTAFDRPRYQQLIPQHIRDMYNLPGDVRANLEKGGFTVSLLGRPGHSIGIDEAHEMCINRECKEFVSRPSAETITRISLFLPIRAEAMKNIEQQLFKKQKIDITPIKSLYATSNDNESRKLEGNIKKQVNKLESCSLVTSTCNDALCHLFNKKQLTPQQEHDLINFRSIGETEYRNRVQYYILKTPSVKPPKHRKRLLTFTEKLGRRKKGSEIERERKIQIELWKRRVAHATITGTNLSKSYEQCLELPRAIANIDGTPTKGAKSNTTNVLQKRYEKANAAIIASSLKPGWIPDAVIIEGMFLINITPWSAHKNIGDYADFLIRQHIYPYFRSRSQEVHLLFDDPECVQLSPKYFERLHRDKTAHLNDDHQCTTFAADMVIPPMWRKNILSCRLCKRNLVTFLSTYFLKKVQRKLALQQKFVTAGGFSSNLQNKCLFVTGSTPQPQVDDSLYCNAEESDTRIWLHVINSVGTRKLVLSPDTDVYHVGLPLVAGTQLECNVRLSLFNSTEHRFLDIQALLTAFENDPSLAAIEQLPAVMQMLYISTGCDFVSFFNGIGKATFMATLFEYSQFICDSTAQTPGMLSQPDADGFLSFIRLVGCAYFRKHKSVFLPSFPTPMSLFNSLLDSKQHAQVHHSAWLSLMREKIWLRIKYEEEMIPSYDALDRHWKRSCWVQCVWSQATSNNITYPVLDGNGWKRMETG
ncbi:uncharacterized protein LOC135333611 [Halichondria panicea]|uniref:uncharacterized protein LOC135333611 n=1 Tax=Halichondria panicea TaxID=6063 RepID=UPI00312B86A9